MKNVTSFIYAAALMSTTLVSGAVQASNQIDVQGFSARVTRSDFPAAFDMRVLSATGNTVKIGLAGVGADETYGGLFHPITEEGMGATGWEEFFYNWASTDLKFDVKQGYRVTSVTLSGNTSGTLAPWKFTPDGYHDGNDGTASTLASWGLGTSWENRVVSNQTNVEGTESFSVAFSDTATPEFSLTISNYVEATLRSGKTTIIGADFPSTTYYASSATLDFSNIVLSVEVAPVSAVPEPGTYAMLLGGLALLGLASRRHR